VLSRPKLSSSRVRTSSRPPAMRRLEFRHTGGSHGLQYDGTVVLRVSDQAKELGVRPGWKIYMIDDHIVSGSEEIWNLLQEAAWEWRSCYVSFVTDLKSVRKEQQMLRTAELEAEAERLAKLPFAGSHDRRHVSQVKEEFTFQGYIDRSEERAITFPLLQKVVRFAEERCHRWRDPAPPGTTETSGQKLHIDMMNMYHLFHWLIKPATKEKECSLVELLSNERQRPAWFVINWWGNLLVDMAKCVEVHLRTRRLGDSTGFWCSAFANRPHSISGADDDLKRSFHRAMSAANFHVLLIVDRKRDRGGPGLVFQRLWCLYELSTCLDNPNTTLDIVTCQGPKPSLIMAGLTEEEERLERGQANAGLKAKTEREKSFSLDLVELGLSLDVQSAVTTELGDKQHLLNTIAGKDLREPVAPHDTHVKLNKRICASLALAFWRRGLCGATSDSDWSRVQGKLLDAIRCDVWRESLDLSMSFLPSGDEKVKLLLRSLPHSLKRLKIDLRETDATNENVTSFVAGLPADLEDLTMDLSYNDAISDVGIETLVETLPPRLKSLKLDLSNNPKVSKEIQECGTLEGLRDHLAASAQKGTLFSTFCLIPSQNRRMIVETTKGTF